MNKSCFLFIHLFFLLREKSIVAFYCGSHIVISTNGINELLRGGQIPL